MSSDPAPDQSAADGYVQRAQLLAELGRYDEAAGELAYGLALQPDDVDALTMLARVHLAAGRPAEALTAADTAVAAAPEALPAAGRPGHGPGRSGALQPSRRPPPTGSSPSARPTRTPSGARRRSWPAPATVSRR